MLFPAVLSSQTAPSIDLPGATQGGSVRLSGKIDCPDGGCAPGRAFHRAELVRAARTDLGIIGRQRKQERDRGKSEFSGGHPFPIGEME